MYALSLQSLFNWEFLPTALALKFFLLCGFLVQCLKMLSKNFLAGKTRFTLGTGIVLFTAKATCEEPRTAQFCPHFKIKINGA